MPYKSIAELPASIKKLSQKAQELFLSAFNEAYKRNSEATAFKIAWAAVKKKYGGKKVAKSSSFIPKIYVGKSMSVESKAFVGEFIFSDVASDLDGDSVDKMTLFRKLNGMEGDLEHANLFRRNEISRVPLFTVIDSSFDGTRLKGRVLFDSGHPQFNTVWEYCKKGEFGISLEYENSLMDISGISGTMVPRNPRSKILAAYEF